MLRNTISHMLHRQLTSSILQSLRIVSPNRLLTSSYFSSAFNTQRNTAYEHSFSTTLQDIIEKPSVEDTRATVNSIFDDVNCHIADDPGRLFAIIQILGKQYRVVTHDIILIERNWPPTINDKLIFEKVLLLGGSSFTLIGKPLLPRNLVYVSGIIVHKDLTHTKMRFHHPPKKRVHNLNFVKEELTYIRINEISAFPKVNILEDIEYLRS